jgi:hypothetical protein
MDVFTGGSPMRCGGGDEAIQGDLWGRCITNGRRTRCAHGEDTVFMLDGRAEYQGDPNAVQQLSSTSTIFAAATRR